MEYMQNIGFAFLGVVAVYLAYDFIKIYILKGDE